MRNILWWFFAFITFIPAFTYCVSCFTPYISPVTFPPMAFLALGFPYLACSLIIFIIIWFFIKKKVAVFLLLLFFAGYKNLFATFALDFSAQKDKVAKAPGALRILTWNVRNFDNPSTYADTPKAIRRQMFNYIRDSEADVLCLQEFTEHIANGALSNTTELVDLGYVYYYKTNDITQIFPYGNFISGTAIFSKVPLIDSGKTLLGDSSYPEHVAHVDLMMHDKRIRIFSAHFKSLNLFVDKSYPGTLVPFHNDTNFIRRSGRLEKIKTFDQDHAKEALIAKTELKKSPYAVVFTADMNSVPTSYAFHLMSSGLKDAFVAKGWGLGTTMDNLPNTLRIDLLLVDKKFCIRGYHKEEIHLSDHFPQMVDLQW